MVLLVMGYVHIGREKQHTKASEICKNLLLQLEVGSPRNTINHQLTGY
ncbi:hypothetical protein CIPAW_09G170100 [Carya illinoinensis]|uniref:Uncharacterized protein n=1 Tax=Carya illinoinensis TaxID=32201 RepID=A0A8T1PIY5_CARIL|nr:hypothetical protein CIPAW_09G170100 [Carya illinoinensis]